MLLLLVAADMKWVILVSYPYTSMRAAGQSLGSKSAGQNTGLAWLSALSLAGPSLLGASLWDVALRRRMGRTWRRIRLPFPSCPAPFSGTLAAVDNDGGALVGFGWAHVLKGWPSRPWTMIILYGHWVSNVLDGFGRLLLTYSTIGGPDSGS